MISSLGPALPRRGSRLMKQRAALVQAPIRVRFVVQRQIVIAGYIRIGPTTGTPVAGDEIRARLNLLEPGVAFQFLRSKRTPTRFKPTCAIAVTNKATVEHAEIPDPRRRDGTRRIVMYTITPGDQGSRWQIRRHNCGFRSGVGSTFA